jgi:tetratricopeptide (TPR) repeat protein
MSDVKQVHTKTENENVVDRAKDFWSQYSRPLTIVLGVLILLFGGWFGYKKLVKEPNERKAAEVIFKAEDYFSRDSLRLALNGDGRNPGLVKIADQYGGTKAGNRAKFLAGASYLRLEDYKNAEKYLKDADLESEIVQARAYKLLADAYAAEGKNKEALTYYKKAGHQFKDDDINSPEYLYMAAYLAHKVLGDKQEAINLYKELKLNYPNSGPAFEADKLLAELGVYNAE